MARQPNHKGAHVFPTDEEIAQRTFEIFFAERDPARSLVDYWRTAENELLDRAARQAVGPRAPRPKRANSKGTLNG